MDEKEIRPFISCHIFITFFNNPSFVRFPLFFPHSHSLCLIMDFYMRVYIHYLVIKTVLIFNLYLYIIHEVLFKCVFFKAWP